MKPVKLIVVGAGIRGNRYAKYACELCEGVDIVGIAEPREFNRNYHVSKYNIPAENVFTDWKDLVQRKKFADAVIIATQDQMHTEPAVAFAQQGYHILLEKPMATNPQECRRIVEAAVESKKIFAVCHVMLYTNYTQKLKAIIDSGVIGEIVSIQHTEPVGYWHQAHSFVRGNWNNESKSSPMLLAKSCHDIDWIRYIMDSKCVKISSFGNLKHFTKENKPKGSTGRCMSCPCETRCPYSAKKIYIGRARNNNFGWPNEVLTSDLTVEGVTEAVEKGPYGRCVYECDNDVVDHQVVNMLFEGGQTASFTMTAFSEYRGRTTSIFGTHGELYGNSRYINHYDFLTDKTERIDTLSSGVDINSGHGGGDQAFVKGFIEAVRQDDYAPILSDPWKTLESHLMVFAAEKSRREGVTVEL